MMFRFKILIAICVLGAILVEIVATKEHIVGKALGADLERELNTSLRKLSANFEQAAKCLKERMRNGVPNLKIPQLDPIKIPVIPLIINNDHIQSKMFLTDIKLEGISDFNLTDGALTGWPTPKKLHVRVLVDSVTFNTGYQGNMTLFKMLNIYGNGNANITVKKIEFDMKINLKVSIWTMRIKLTGLDLAIKLPSIEASITGLFNNERVSQLISERLTEVINALISEQSDNVNRLVRDALWSILSNDVNAILKNINALKMNSIIENYIKILCSGLDDFPGYHFNKFQAGIENYINDKLQGNL